MAINSPGMMTTHPEVYQAFYEQVIAPRCQLPTEAQ